METVPSRREREHRQRRREILEAARAVFAEKGYLNATIEDVARHAEFGKGTVYNYFQGGKQELLYAILDDLHDELCNLVESAFSPEATSGRSFRETFCRFIETLFTRFVEREDLFPLLVREAQRLVFSEDDEKAAYLWRQSNRVVGALVGPLQQAIDEGRIRPLPVEAMAHTIFGNVQGMMMHRCLAVRRDGDHPANVMTAQDAARFLSTMLLDGLLAHPEPSSR